MAGMSGFPVHLVEINHVEPVPRRIRAYLGGRKVLDTTRAVYVWEIPFYPQLYIPVEDVNPQYLVRTGRTSGSRRGPVEECGLTVDGVETQRAARLHADDTVPGLRDRLRFAWEALDSWFEEDEEVFVHPRNPYSRVDALRSTRTVRVEVDGTLLAESSSPVLLFETGLVTRYYLDPTDVDFTICAGTTR